MRRHRASPTPGAADLGRSAESESGSPFLRTPPDARLPPRCYGGAKVFQLGGTDLDYNGSFVRSGAARSRRRALSQRRRCGDDGVLGTYRRPARLVQGARKTWRAYLTRARGPYRNARTLYPGMALESSGCGLRYLRSGEPALLVARRTRTASRRRRKRTQHVRALWHGPAALCRRTENRRGVQEWSRRRLARTRSASLRRNGSNLSQWICRASRIGVDPGP